MYAAIEQMKAGQHDRRRRRQAPQVRRRRVRHRHPAAVRALHRPLAVRGHVDLARLLAGLPGRAQGEHVLRGRDLRRPPGPRADGPPRGEPARHQGRPGGLHQAPVRRGGLLRWTMRDAHPGHGPRLRRTSSIEHEVLEPLGRASSCWRRQRTRTTLADLAAGADGDPRLLRAGHRARSSSGGRGGCRVIARYGIGYDNIDVEAATAPRHRRDQRPGLLPRRGRRPHARAPAGGRARPRTPRSARCASGGWAIAQAGVHRIAGRRLALVGVGRHRPAGRGARAGVRD